MSKPHQALALVLLISVLSVSSLRSGDNPYDLSNVVVSSTGLTAIATYHLGDSILDSAQEKIIKYLLINITFDSPQRLRLRITDNSSPRWEVPYDLSLYTIQGSNNLYSVSYTTSPMGLKVTRTSDQVTVFNLDPNLFFSYDDQDILFTNSLGSSISVMGLGERITSFVIPTGAYTLFSNGQPSPIDNGEDLKGNMYSIQTFHVIVRADGSCFGGFLYNSNAMTATVGQDFLSFRLTGGVIDYWVFMGPRPEDVVFQYHQLVNFPVQLPYWSLGWHQCRYGFKNSSQMLDVLNKYNQYNLPLDVLWSDIDYMSSFQDFELDPVNFPLRNMTQLVQTLQSTGKHWVPITDAGTAQNLSDPYYVKGSLMNVWIQDPYSAGPAVGVVWPGNATFIDWAHPNSTLYWNYCLDSFLSLISFSGIWLDMNEIESFSDGNVGHSPSIINNLTMPWTPGYDLNTNTLDMASTHYDAFPQVPNSNIEYNYHSLYGYLESKATSQWYMSKKTRPFIISRSTFAGHGQWASHWLGDNYSQWNFIEYSIVGVFNFGMFAIPMVGADICGFKGNSNLELCARWTELGALYPFARNHNDIYSIDQFPWSFGQELIDTNFKAIRNRYMLYMYLYTHMTRLSIEGGQFFKPAFWAYPNDLNLLKNATSSFMLGDALIVHPCIWHGVTGSTSFFPDDIWYNLYDGDFVFLDYDNSAYLDMSWPGLINIHVTLGHIVPLLDNYLTAMSSRDTRNSNLTLIVTQSGTADAVGHLIFDDGLTYGVLKSGEYTEVEFNFYSYNSTFDIFTIQTNINGYKRAQGEWPFISTLVFYGCTASPENVYIQSSGQVKLAAVNIYWNAAKMICKIWLKDYLQPDQAATIYIDYLI